MSTRAPHASLIRYIAIETLQTGVVESGTGRRARDGADRHAARLPDLPPPPPGSLACLAPPLRSGCGAGPPMPPLAALSVPPAPPALGRGLPVGRRRRRQRRRMRRRPLGWAGGGRRGGRTSLRRGGLVRARAGRTRRRLALPKGMGWSLTAQVLQWK